MPENLYHDVLPYAMVVRACPRASIDERVPASVGWTSQHFNSCHTFRQMRVRHLGWDFCVAPCAASTRAKSVKTARVRAYRSLGSSSPVESSHAGYAPCAARLRRSGARPLKSGREHWLTLSWYLAQRRRNLWAENTLAVAHDGGASVNRRTRPLPAAALGARRQYSAPMRCGSCDTP